MADYPTPFISVIVPFYNIKACVGYCLDSLLAQDYEGDYEVLCVDDGSTDGTSEELDDRSKLSQRLRVFHKANGGQSSARNYGVERSAAEYVSFVDGDDVVSPYYLSSLARGLDSEGDVLVIGAHQVTKSSKVSKISWLRPNNFVHMTCSESLREIAYMRISDSACGRLAPRSLYQDNQFPEGVIYEDTFVAARHVVSGAFVTYVNQPIYGYVMREGSTIHPKAESLKRCFQYIEAIDEFCKGLNIFFSEESDEQVLFRAISYSRLWRRLDIVKDCPTEAAECQHEIQAYVGRHLKQLLRCTAVSEGNKLRLLLLSKYPSLYRYAFRIYDRLARGVA